MDFGFGNAAEILMPARLLEQAKAASGRQAMGPSSFQEALEILCESAIREAKLEGLQLAQFAGVLHGLLVNRLNLYADRAAFPEIGQQKIVEPLIVTGLPRSGTTILHAMLAQDPSARSPQKWEVDEPSPPPRAETYSSDPRIARCAARVAQLPAEFRAMHAVEATLPDECNSIQALAFRSVNFGAIANLPSYIDWLVNHADMQPAYELHMHVLQHLQAFAPGGHWVLKGPPHLHWLDCLFDTYPDARLVVTHRDPAEVMPSNASLMGFLLATTREDQPALGQVVIRQWHAAVVSAMLYRRTGAHGRQFFDTYYTDFIASPMRVVAAIYDHFGLSLTEQADRRMRAFLDDNAQTKHGKHIYVAEDYGMTQTGLRQTFADYMTEYAIDPV